MVGEGVGVGVAVGVGVRTTEGDGVVEGDGAFEDVADAYGVLLAAWLLLVDDVHPATDSEVIMTSTMTANNFFVIQSPP
jgi:hypothetical protein